MSIEDKQADVIERLTRERDAYASALNTSNEAFFQKVKEFSIIKRISASINATLDPRRICTGIVDLIVDETIVENCSLWLVNRQNGFVELAAVRGQSQLEPRFFDVDERGDTRMKLGSGIAGMTARTGESMLINDTRKSEQFTQRRSEADIRSLLCMPIKADNRVFGVLNMSHPDVGAFTEGDQRLLELISEQAAVAFKNLVLFEEIRALNQALEAKVAERTEHLVRSEERYERAVSAGRVGIWDWKLDSDQIYVAPNLVQMLGYEPHENPGLVRFWLRQIHPKDRRVLLGVIRAFTSGKKDVNEGELRMRCKDGRYCWFFVRGAVVRDPGGRVIRIAGSHSDVTRRKQAELEVANLQKEALTHAHAAGKAEFATTVLHNIGNVLNSVNVDSMEIRRSVRSMRLERLSMAFDMLKANEADLGVFFKTEKGSQLKTYLMKIMELVTREGVNLRGYTEEIQNKIAIARDIIETQQSYAKGNELKKQDLVQLVDEALKIQHESIRKRGILLKKKYAAVRPIQLPSAKIIHLLINLVKNSVEAMAGMPKDGRVLSVELGEIDKKSVFIDVEDNGMGIAPENLAKMFSHGFTTKVTGHGFGLRWCQKTVQELGGEIAVESDGEGKGARFHIVIPYERPKFEPKVDLLLDETRHYEAVLKGEVPEGTPPPEILPA